MAHLPSYDCIYCILKYLQNYHSTLFNCLLVNRLWCEAAVPLLYSNPFDNISDKSDYSIILTLILCFNKTEILQLKNQLKLLNIDNMININDEYKALFEYPKYLEIFNCNKISSTIFRWFHSYHGYYTYCHDIDIKFIPIFYQSILHQCDNIKQLDVSLYDIQIFNLSNLIKLNSLRLNCVYVGRNKVAQNFLSNIESICSNLKTLEIHSLYTFCNNTGKEKLCAIIQKQNNLKVFKASYCKDLLNDILLSLEFQKHSLVYIEFKRIKLNDISFKNLLNLYNLKYLKVDNCGGVSLDQCKIFEFSSFKLETLIFIYHWKYDDLWNNNLFSMIKYLGVSLKELRLDNNFLLDSHVIKNISIYCPNLINLEITISSIYTNDLVFHQYFKNLQIRNLKILRHNVRNEDIFVNLANHLPTSVKQVSFCDGFFDYLQFKKFLENCHNDLETINFTNNTTLNQPLNLLLSYIERSNNNNLKFLGLARKHGFKKVSNDEELNLLRQIKAKGIKIGHFNSYEDSLNFII